MQSMNRLFAVVLVSGGALLSLGCIATEDFNPESDQNTATATSALQADAVTTSASAEEQAKIKDRTRRDRTRRVTTMSGTSGDVVRRGNTFNYPVTIGIGETVTFWTSNGVPDTTDRVDTVLALYRRHDNSTSWINPPWTAKVGIRTLAIDDDGNGYPYSMVSYTNTSGQVENAWLMGFAYRYYDGTCHTGTVDVSGTIYLSQQPFTSCSLPWVQSTRGEAFTAASTGGSYPDPALFVFDAYSGSDNGGWNDDDPRGGLESRYEGLTNLPVWIVPVAPGREAGESTIYY